MSLGSKVWLIVKWIANCLGNGSSLRRHCLVFMLFVGQAVFVNGINSVTRETLTHQYCCVRSPRFGMVGFGTCEPHELQ